MRTWIGIVVIGMSLVSVAIADDFTRVSGQHIRLITDVAPDEAAELVASFDAAVPQWAELLELAPNRLDDWSVDAWVMRDVDRFYDTKQIAADVPDFRMAYALNNRVYVKAQSSRYYTRHLLLHEGTHSLAIDVFGGLDPLGLWKESPNGWELTADQKTKSKSVRSQRLPRKFLTGVALRH